MSGSAAKKNHFLRLLQNPLKELSFEEAHELFGAPPRKLILRNRQTHWVAALTILFAVVAGIVLHHAALNMSAEEWAREPLSKPLGIILLWLAVILFISGIIQDKIYFMRYRRRIDASHEHLFPNGVLAKAKIIKELEDIRTHGMLMSRQITKVQRFEVEWLHNGQLVQGKLEGRVLPTGIYEGVEILVLYDPKDLSQVVALSRGEILYTVKKFL